MGESETAAKEYFDEVRKLLGVEDVEMRPTPTDLIVALLNKAIEDLQYQEEKWNDLVSDKKAITMGESFLAIQIRTSLEIQSALTVILKGMLLMLNQHGHGVPWNRMRELLDDETAECPDKMIEADKEKECAHHRMEDDKCLDCGYERGE